MFIMRKIGRLGLVGVALCATLLGSGCSRVNQNNSRLNLEGFKPSEQTELREVYENPKRALKGLQPETREFLETYSPDNLTDGQKKLFEFMGVNYKTPNLKERTLISYVCQGQAGVSR